MTQQVPVLADLHKVRPAIYWTDLTASAGLGWAAFAVAAAQPLGSAASAAAAVVAVFALYRSLAFTPEISHQRQQLPGFEAAWNWLIGFPLLLPSFTYAEVHFDHHRVATYGTAGSGIPAVRPLGRDDRRLLPAHAIHPAAAGAALPAASPRSRSPRRRWSGYWSSMPRPSLSTGTTAAMPARG